MDRCGGRRSGSTFGRTVGGSGRWIDVVVSVVVPTFRGSVGAVGRAEGIVHVQVSVGCVEERGTDRQEIG